jgi:broad specificity phosphatase PhoE
MRNARQLANYDPRVVIFVRHGRAVVQADVRTDDWPLDPAHLTDIETLRGALPDLPVVCSGMRRAVETARFFGSPTVDPRLAEVSRPWTDDLEPSIARYFAGEPLPGWEPQEAARARFRAAIRDHGRAIYVSHGTLLSLYLASAVPALNAMRFWSELRNPDAWQLDSESLVRVVAPGN